MDKVKFKKYLSKSVYFITMASGVFLALFALLFGIEAIEVYFDDTDYVWGAACFPWYYETREIYIASAIIESFVSLTVAFFMVRSTHKGKSKQQLIIWGLFLLFLLFHNSWINKYIVFSFAEFIRF